MSPEIVVAIVAAVGKVSDTIFQRLPLGGRRPSDEERAKRAIHTVYDKLRPEITPTLVRVLLALEGGRNLLAAQIRPKVYPKRTFTGTAEREFDHEFEYRCRMLCLLALTFRVGGSEYTLTPLGQSFLNRAREIRDYPEVFLA